MADLGLAEVFDGAPVAAAWFNAVAAAVQAHEDQLSGEWTDYVPTWDGSTTDPVIGNGVFGGQWIRSAQSGLVHFRVRGTMGSTSTYGSGFYTVGLPATPAPLPAGTLYLTAYGIVVDTSGASRIPVLADPFGGGIVLAVPSGGVWSPTVPFTLANGDWIIINGFYEPT